MRNIKNQLYFYPFTPSLLPPTHFLAPPPSPTKKVFTKQYHNFVENMKTHSQCHNFVENMKQPQCFYHRVWKNQNNTDDENIHKICTITTTVVLIHSDLTWHTYKLQHANTFLQHGCKQKICTNGQKGLSLNTPTHFNCIVTNLYK